MVRKLVPVLVALLIWAPCIGFAASEMEQVVESHSSEVQQCYEKNLQTDPAFSGSLTLGWEVRVNRTFLNTALETGCYT